MRISISVNVYVYISLNIKTYICMYEQKSI